MSVRDAAGNSMTLTHRIVVDSAGVAGELSAPAKAPVTTDDTDAATTDEPEAAVTVTAEDDTSSSAEAAASTEAQDADAETDPGPSNWWVATIVGIGSLFAGLFAKRRLSR